LVKLVTLSKEEENAKTIGVVVNASEGNAQELFAIEKIKRE